MAARSHSADPRAERVRTRLREAAFALAHERPVDALTVGDIVARAEVSRQVFYQHFTDRDDAVATAFTVAFAAATAEDGSRLEGTTVGGDPRARILRLFGFAAEHRSMYRNIVPSAVTQRVVTAFRTELTPACEAIAAQGMPVVSPIAGLAPDSVSRFLVGGFMEVLRSWMEDPDSAELGGRVSAALDTVNALLGLTTSSKGSANG
ncbi:MAG TPA: helix-turn-helix domain-containing protein [Mycobacterium sp.]|nr:helix-turn-helix domain-containing protein [Mycobacterium sp.]